MTSQHILHPADALSCSLNLAAVASCWCCRLVDIPVLPPGQPKWLFCREVSGCGHLHPEKIECGFIRCYSRWDFSFPHPQAPLLCHTNLPLQLSVGALQYPAIPAATRATRRHCIELAVDRLCTGWERLTHCALPFAMLQAALLASGEGWKRELIGSLTPINTLGVSHSRLAVFWGVEFCVGFGLVCLFVCLLACLFVCLFVLFCFV